MEGLSTCGEEMHLGVEAEKEHISLGGTLLDETLPYECLGG